MLELEHLGFLHQPHTSAGRVPTDKGYRFFVDVLMGDRELSKTEQQTLQAELLKLRAQYQRLAKSTAKTLAALSENNVAITASAGKGQDVYEAGLKQLLARPEFAEDNSRALQVVDMLEYIDEHVDEIMKETEKKSVSIYIGDENPHIHGAKGVSMIRSRDETETGDEGIIAILGPNRMQYKKNASLVAHLTKLIGSGLLTAILVVI